MGGLPKLCMSSFGCAVRSIPTMLWDSAARKQHVLLQLDVSRSPRTDGNLRCVHSSSSLKYICTHLLCHDHRNSPLVAHLHCFVVTHGEVSLVVGEFPLSLWSRNSLGSGFAIFHRRSLQLVGFRFQSWCFESLILSPNSRTRSGTKTTCFKLILDRGQSLTVCVWNM